MTSVEQINKLIAELSEEERGKVSDGKLTFGDYSVIHTAAKELVKSITELKGKIKGAFQG